MSWRWAEDPISPSAVILLVPRPKEKSLHRMVAKKTPVHSQRPSLCLALSDLLVMSWWNCHGEKHFGITEKTTDQYPSYMMVLFVGKMTPKFDPQVNDRSAPPVMLSLVDQTTRAITPFASARDLGQSAALTQFDTRDRQTNQTRGRAFVPLLRRNASSASAQLCFNKRPPVRINLHHGRLSSIANCSQSTVQSTTHSCSWSIGYQHAVNRISLSEKYVCPIELKMEPRAHSTTSPCIRSGHPISGDG